MSAVRREHDRRNRCKTCGDVLDAGVFRCPRDGTVLGDSPDPWVGATLAGRYRLVARLGRGGMSSVYLARHAVIDRIAAVKILRSELAHDPIQRDRFLREARAVNRIQHENIIDITDFGETGDGTVFLVMEYVPGESLLAALGRGPLAPRRALRIARQIAMGLGRAHLMNVVHRDLKPDNVLLVSRDDGTDLVKLLDFGIAKLLDAPALTQANKVFGTPGYIAPEYALGGPLTPRSDLYSLGVVLYETVTASLPFDSDHIGDLMLKHVVEPPVAPRTRVPSLPEAVERLILRLLEKKPEDRFVDAFHLLEEIDRVLRVLDADPLADATPVLPDHRSLFALGPPVHIDGIGRDDESVTRVRRSLQPSQPVDTELTPVEPNAHVALEYEAPARLGVLDVSVPESDDPLVLAEGWSVFVGGLKSALDARYWAEIPEPVAAAVRALHGAVAQIEAGRDVVLGCRERLLAMEAEARTFRTNIGHASDTLAADLSVKHRARDAAASRHDELTRARAQTEAGPKLDALVWELAACEEVLRDAVASAEDLEFQLAELARQWERINENFERDQRAVLAQMAEAVEALGGRDRAARAAVEALDQRIEGDARGR